ncbi:hypothetical protein BCR33DRAFT_324961 [Rhizoclosmatium globosum]|uniref:IGFBP N-terminal domain-containing protein n=1 Tax=Rhizoclosmatium globosum TaxID=329046 RepID=A0A1Y2D030_9FUNG|nr:hypothetical protein BCR33DRAFT_324961 [Rhizoclosmatium globosum]|eukprot:ORY52652.1 hypothetical protein BCR33DRAFT_324961 [Rhizoclosmatium globosum]
MQPSLLFIVCIAAIAHAADPVSEGGVCGGGTANAPICVENLDCISTGGPGSTGICTRKSSDVGGPCEQLDFPDTSARCKVGLACEPAIVPAIFPPPKGIAGKCVVQQISDVGGPCLEPKLVSAICMSGLVCVPASIPQTGPASITSGTCQPTPQEYVPVGGVCGGGTQNAPICQSNLDCVTQTGAIGATGICTIKTSEAGGECQQDFPNSAVCKAGLICVPPTRPAVGPAPAGAPGMCQFTPDKYVPVGGACGGASPTSPVCESGLDCLVPPPFNYKAQGICTRRETDVGGSCQPSVQNSTPCKAGLICVLPSPPTPGGFGTCQRLYVLLPLLLSLLQSRSLLLYQLPQHPSRALPWLLKE